MAETVKLKFTSPEVEQEIRRICNVHRVEFSRLTEFANEHLTLVEVGSVDLPEREMIRKDIYENPSKRLEGLLLAYICGATKMMEQNGTGRRFPIGAPTTEETLKEIDDYFDRLDLWERHGGDNLLDQCPDINLTKANVL